MSEISDILKLWFDENDPRIVLSYEDSKFGFSLFKCSRCWGYRIYVSDDRVIFDNALTGEILKLNSPDFFDKIRQYIAHGCVK